MGYTFFNDRTLIIKEDAAIGHTSTDEDALALMNFFSPISQKSANVLITYENSAP